MGYDNKLYNLSTEASIARRHVHCSSEALRVKSGNEQSYGSSRLSVVAKIEGDDDARSIECRRGGRVHSHSAQAAIKQQIKKRRREKRKAEDENEDEDEDEEGGSLYHAPLFAELRSPRYVAYRDKQRQRARDRPGETPVWDDELENAFQMAIRIVPPVGRKKEHRRGKLCGRNERISHLIKRWTGKIRTRKQISSHIQVLKPFMINNEEWLQHVTANNAGSAAMSTAQSCLQELDLENLNDDDFRVLIRDPFSQLGPRKPTEDLKYPPPNAILGSNAPDHGPVLNRIEFEMYVLSPAGEKIHNYTRLQAEIGASPIALEELSNWRMYFPLLEDYHENGQLDSDIILIESNVDLLTDYPPKNSTLSIRFRVNVAGVAGNKQWFTKADYYEENGQPIDMGKFYEINNIRKSSPWDTPSVSQAPGSRDVQLEISLQSVWWVQLFTRMAARKHGLRYDHDFFQQEEDWSRRYLQGLSVMQELRMGSGTSSERVAIILWKFSAASRGKTATTTWRKLKPPPQRFKINSPVLSPEAPLQHSMVLDSSIHNIAMPQPIFARAERFLHQSDIFAQDSERIVSEPQSARVSLSPALTPDYMTSFPSSTTTSFPPSVTHGYLSHEESQESACYSQDGQSYRKEGFASQDPFDIPQKTTYDLQELRAYKGDLNHPSENLELGSQDAPYYAQHSLEPMPGFRSTIQYDEELCQDGLNPDGPHATYDFSGGQIQLSLQTHVPSEFHPPPYMNPPACIAHFEGPAQMGGQISDLEFHAATEDLSALQHEPEMMPASLPQHEDLDFSAWDAPFTPDEVAALRSHNGGFHIQNNLQHTHHETDELAGHQDHVHTESDWTLIQMRRHLHEATQEQQVGQDAVVGGIQNDNVVGAEEDHPADGADNDFGFEEIYAPESQLVESQAVQTQGDQHVDGGGLEHDYDDHDLHEDHL
ncbi:MAG: hypothetical protein Q9213_002834 [Squamulea squamosa]